MLEQKEGFSESSFMVGAITPLKAQLTKFHEPIYH